MSRVAPQPDRRSVTTRWCLRLDRRPLRWRRLACDRPRCRCCGDHRTRCGRLRFVRTTNHRLGGLRLGYRRLDRGTLRWRRLACDRPPCRCCGDHRPRCGRLRFVRTTNHRLGGLRLGYRRLDRGPLRWRRLACDRCFRLWCDGRDGTPSRLNTTALLRGLPHSVGLGRRAGLCSSFGVGIGQDRRW